MKVSTNNLSLRTKILAISLGMALTIAAVGTFELQRAVRMSSATALNNFGGFAKQLNDAIAAQFFERYGDAQAFALNAVLRNKEDQTTITERFNDYAALYGIYDVILYVDTDGHYIASNDKTPQGKPLDVEPLKRRSYENEPWFKAVMNDQFTEDKERNFFGTYFEDAMIDPIVAAVSDQKALGTSFSAAVRDQEGKIIGVVSNRANFSWVEGEIANTKRFVAEQGFPTADVLLLNHNGVVLAETSSRMAENESYSRNMNRVLRANLVKDNVQIAKDLVAGGFGAARSFNEKTRKDEFSGYAFLATPKFIPAIGWGTIIKGTEEEVLAELLGISQRFLISVSGCLVILMILGVLAINRVIRMLSGVTEKLREAAETTTDVASRLTESAEFVATASTEQSAAVQETVSSMGEISSMINQTNEHVRECTGIASDVSTRSDHGHQTMQRLATAMEGVNMANVQLQNIANIINEVSAKTMVINDIVFKTQLLSINASIEAARAGQHGKGFSVVAEEVGNLATMSGSAAKEIQVLISDSQKQVGQILDLIQDRAREGQEVSAEALEAFGQIAAGIKSINEKLQGVVQASREQEAGIKQINNAMGYMDQTTQRNSQNASQTSNLAKLLGQQSAQTYRAIRAMRKILRGVDDTAQREVKKVDIIDEIIGANAGAMAASSEAKGQAVSHVHEGGSLEDMIKKLESKTDLSEGGPIKRDDTSHMAITADDPDFPKAV